MSTRAIAGVKKQMLILFGVGVAAFGLLLYFERDTLIDTWHTLLDANLGFILMLPLIQVINYFFIGQYYRKMFANFGTHFSRARAWGVVAAMNFVNQILPSGGLSGITYLAYGFRSKLSTGKTTLIQVGRYVFAFVGYALLGPLALLLLVVSDNLNQFNEVVDKATGSWGALATLLVFLSIGAFIITMVFKQALSHRLSRMFLAGLNWFKRVILRRKQPIRMLFFRRIYKEFHEGVDFIREQGIGALRPAVYMFLSAVAELAIVYTALLAVNQTPPISVVFTAFVAANIVGVVSIIPGDVGVHEAAVILVLVAFGVPEAAAISATLLYRVFNKFVFLPIGFYFYARILKPAVKGEGV